PAVNGRRSHKTFSRAGASSLPRGFSQCVVDAVLPARPVLLEIFEHVPINSQGDEFLRVGQDRLLRWAFDRLGRCRLEHGFGRLSWVSSSSWLIDAHLIILSPGRDSSP